MMEAGGDLVTLAEELRVFDLENGIDLNLALKKAGRERRQARSRKGWVTRREKEGRYPPPSAPGRSAALRAEPRAASQAKPAAANAGGSDA